jgi:predicted transcriptional regulator
MITPAQLRGARAQLGWSQDDLFRESLVSRPRIGDFELGKRTPQARTVADIVRALESAGIQFFGEGGVELGSKRQ